MPKKVTYEAFEDTELEFEFFLVIKLGLGTVANMRKVMSQKEFSYWVMYYRRDAQRKELEMLKSQS